TDMVLVDSRLAARQATEHLIAQGYARIACITGPAGIRATDDRLAGYRDALHADKQRSTASLVKNAEYHAAGAKAATHALYANKDRPDAILVANNAIAVGTLECLQELGLRPGRDVGVVAFDEAPWTTLIDPPLSVVAQPAHEIGMLAARMLLARIDDPARPPATTTLNARLVERASSQRIR
ncbi:MAG: LacI family DNA-binding transcriptional regulator, partial [Sciscionella sp.]